MLRNDSGSVLVSDDVGIFVTGADAIDAGDRTGRRSGGSRDVGHQRGRRRSDRGRRRLQRDAFRAPGDWTNDSANCAWTAWLKSDSGYGVYFVRGTESDAAPIREISVYDVAQDGSTSGAPITAEGLGIGSTKDEVLAEYPGAQQGVPQIGDGVWIKVPGDGSAHVFFEFREGSDVAWDVTVTTGAEPSYEVCG